MKGFLLFDIDGVLRDVAGSYRLAIQETVNHFIKWRPSLENIDVLKAEGCWNNDWKASQELIKRYQEQQRLSSNTPSLKEIEKIFSSFYFGGDPEGDSQEWKGFIKNEPLLVNQDFFQKLTQQNFVWGFISGAEPSSAKFVLENRLKLTNPPLIAMGDAPDKPNPSGLLKLARILADKPLGQGVPPIAYLGDTVADVLTIQKAQRQVPNQKFLSLAVAPPHLHKPEHIAAREEYENTLKTAGASRILKNTNELLTITDQWNSISN